MLDVRDIGPSWELLFYSSSNFTEKVTISSVRAVKLLSEGYIPNTIARTTDVEKAIVDNIETAVTEQINNSMADWLQNDETAPNYIKNRTHYVEYEYNTAIYSGTLPDGSPKSYDVFGTG
jgi:hypothetical protein